MGSGKPGHKGQRKCNMRIIFRRSLVFEADLVTTEDISHWILQGVCLILNKD